MLLQQASAQFQAPCRSSKQRAALHRCVALCGQPKGGAAATGHCNACSAAPVRSSKHRAALHRCVDGVHNPSAVVLTFRSSCRRVLERMWVAC